MSLYEALDRFVGTGVLACAGLVGNEMPAGMTLDGAAFSRFLIAHQQADEFGAVLDCLANEIYLAKDQRGYAQSLCEAHAATLAEILDAARLGADELAPALDAARLALSASAAAGSPAREQIAEAWVARVAATGMLDNAGLDREACRFMMELLCLYVVEQPRFLTSLKPALGAYREALQAALSAAAADAREIDAVSHGQRGAAAGTDPVTAVGGAQSAAIAEIKARHGVPEAALNRFHAILVTQPLPAAQRIARLDELAAWLAATVAHLTRPGNDPIELRRIKLEAANALCSGDLERAMDLLKEVRQLIRDARRRTEARLAEEMDALKSQMVEEASATARLGELALARFDFETAADLFCDAAANLPAGETALEADYRQRQADALAARAEITGDVRSLQAAATAFRAAMELVSRTADPVAWARLGVGLGDMLMALGQRNRDSTIELEQAAVTYEGVVAVIDKAAHPMRWALVQLSRAATLIELGGRVDRDRHWRAAATALMPALEVFETRGADDLAEAARNKLRLLHGVLGQDAAPPALERPARAS